VSAHRSEWVLATGNPGKLREIRALLADTGIRLHSQSEFGLSAPDETGETFVENALLKARHAAALTGLPAIAEDSGLVVDALGGAPGVRSARFAGTTCSDQDNISRLLALLEGRAPTERTARFHCVVVALRSARDPAPLIAGGEWHGIVAQQAAGTGGFGYDPVFFDPAVGATAAEISLEQKNRISHRARAFASLRALLATEACPAAAELS
jgi:XTP/dITP diphosphohydrolase